MSKKTFERAAQRGLRLIAQVKANQPTLLGDVQRLCDEHEPIDRHETTDTARARHETRHIEVFDAGAYFHDTEWAPFIAAVIRVQRRRLVRNTATGLWNLASETSYHVSNAVFSAHAAGGAIRAHWGIENGTTIRVMSPWARTPVASAKTPAFSLASAVSPPTSCAPTTSPT